MKNQIARALEARPGFLLQTVANDRFQRTMDRTGNVQTWRLVVHDRAERVGSRTAPERREPGQHLEQDRAETEDVRPMIDAQAAHLFRGHVHRSANDRPNLNPAKRHRFGRVARGLGAEQLRQSEVQDLDPAVPGDEQIGRLDIPMRDVMFVCRGETVGDLDRIIDHRPRRQRPRVHPLAERLAFEKLGDDPRRPLVHADIMNGEDIRVIQTACRAGFLFESALAIGIARECRGQELDRDVPLQLRIARAIHLSHAADAETSKELESANSIARGSAHGQADYSHRVSSDFH